MELPRGMRDFAPEEKLARDAVMRTILTQFERYGFAPLETPVLERYEVLSAKYAGGAEILKETFRLTDQGGRELGLRYDLTVPLARFIACHPDVKLPFKRYHVGTVYRDGPIKLGRYREFIQCDADIVGADSAAADAQCLQLGQAVFKALGMKTQVCVNHVGFLREALRKDGVPEEKAVAAMLTLDKLKKIGPDGVRKELGEAGLPSDACDALIRISAKKGTPARLKLCVERYGDLPSLTRLKEVLTLVPKAEFDPGLSRGLSYYTGIVFETFAVGNKVTSSISSGGRYDRMIGSFLDRPEAYPAIGISFGLEPIMDALEPSMERRTPTRLYLIPIRTLTEAMGVAERLRKKRIPTDLDLIGRGVSKNLEYASMMGIPYVAFLGPDELAKGVLKLRDMASGEERLLSEKEIVRAVRG